MNGVTIIFVFASITMQAQNFYFGSDLSYVKQMEDCGATYKEDEESKDPFLIFADHGNNLARFRLWHTPSWQDALGFSLRYSDYQDVQLGILRAKNAGMDVLLDFHLSDVWADPTHQVIPAAWAPVVNDLEALKDSLYNYIYSTLSKLHTEGLLPEIVQIGNETNKGILLSQAVNDMGWSLDWDRNAPLFNEAIKAVRDVEDATGDTIKIAIHIADPSDVNWYIDQFWLHGVQDFDIIGISYYHAWHNELIPTVGNIISGLRNEYPGQEVMIFETGYPWTSDFEDNANNLLSVEYPGYPFSPENQKQWLIDLTQEVIDHGGSGVIYWEPGWVSTGCKTLYGTGSNWENATFFDFNDNLLENGGIAWTAYPYDFTSASEEILPAEFNIRIAQHEHELWVVNQSIEGSSEHFQLMISGIDGKLTGKENVNLGPGEAKMVFEKLNLVNGVYVLSLQNENRYCGEVMIIHK